MSTNVHGHRVWMQNSHVSEKVVTTRTHTTGTTITLVGLALGKIFISRLTHYNAMQAVMHS